MDWSERLHILEYDSAVALRYHGRRKAFLDGLSRVGPAISVIFGSASFAGVISNHPEIAGGAGIVVVIFSALNLAFGWGERARLHERLFREWASLIGKLAMLPEGDDSLRVLEVERAKIDGDSPNQLYALSAICENEEKEVRGYGALVRIGRWQRAFANWGTIPGWRAELLRE